MELLEFKNEILKLCKAESVSQVGEVLLRVVLNNDCDFFEKYSALTDNTKDWLQALWQYYEADRTEKKQDYTPKSLCKLVSVIGGKAETLYDCCGGSGALTKSYVETNKTKTVYVEELDERVIPFLLFNLCLQNISGYVVNGNVLTKEQIKTYKLTSDDKYSRCEVADSIGQIKADVSISNPPYNIKWNAPTELEALADGRFPIVPHGSNANYAFVLNCLSKAEKVIMILPNGVLNDDSEKEIRKYLVDNDFVETIAIMPEKMFEVTSISTCLYVLNKNKRHKGQIAFIDSRKNHTVEEREQNGQFGGASHTGRTYTKKYNALSDDNISKILGVLESREEIPEFSAFVDNAKIAENDYILVPSRYIRFEEKQEPHRDFQEIADNINYISRMQNACKLVINESLAKKIGIDIETFKQGEENSKELQNAMKPLGISLRAADYVKFTKNKNEFTFMCNDKDLLPDIFIHFFGIWTNQIALLNTMQNNYLAELRDSLLPELMSGIIEVDL